MAIEDLSVGPRLFLSTSSELNLRLRWIATLYGRLPVSLAVTGGVHSATDAVKAVMTGPTPFKSFPLSCATGSRPSAPW